MKKQISIEVEEETAELLQVLCDGKYPIAKTVEQVVAHLVHSAADGIRRPGSWERGWLEQAFGHEWQSKLESDPTCGWHDRPRRGGQ